MQSDTAFLWKNRFEFTWDGQMPKDIKRAALLPVNPRCSFIFHCKRI